MRKSEHFQNAFQQLFILKNKRTFSSKRRRRNKKIFLTSTDWSQSQITKMKWTLFILFFHGYLFSKQMSSLCGIARIIHKRIFIACTRAVLSTSFARTLHTVSTKNNVYRIAFVLNSMYKTIQPIFLPPPPLRSTDFRILLQTWKENTSN